MSNELLDIDETGEGKIDDSTLKMINLSRRWLVPLAVVLLAFGAGAFFVIYMILEDKNYSVDLKLRDIVGFSCIAAFGIGNIASGVYLMKFASMIKELNRNPSTNKLNQVLRINSTVIITWAISMIVFAFLFLFITAMNLFED